MKKKRERGDEELFERVRAFYALGSAGWDAELDKKEEDGPDFPCAVYPCGAKNEEEGDDGFRIPMHVRVLFNDDGGAEVCNAYIGIRALTCWSRIRHSPVLNAMLSGRHAHLKKFLSTLEYDSPSSENEFHNNWIPELVISVTSFDRVLKLINIINWLTERSPENLSDSLFRIETDELIQYIMLANEVNVLVTGGTGFFGHNLIKLLLADPRIGKINVYARHPPPTERKLSALVAERIITAVGQCDGYASDVLHKDCVGQSDDENAIFGSFDAKNRIQLFYGDIARNESILIQAMTGCSIVFHACGDTRWWNAINSSQYMTNVIGTTMVLNRAADLGVKRVIHTSTVDVMGHGPGVINEDYWKEYSFADFGYNYADTKRDAELSISLFNNSRGPIGLLGRSVALPEVVIIRPGSMLGAWDVTDKYGRLFKEIKEKSLAGIPSGGTSVCHVEDVAKAHIAAAFLPSETLDKSGRVFICAGDNMTYRELFHAMRRMLKMDSNGKTIGFLGPCGCEVIPRPILVAYGWLCELWSTHVSKKEPEINPGMARYMSCNAFYDSSLAVKYLGYAGEGRSAQAIADSHEWYRVRGRI